MKKKFFLLFLLISFGLPSPLQAKNPFSSYFSGLLDESRAETAIGNVLFNCLFQECGGSSKIATYTELNKYLEEFSKNCSRSNIPFRIFVLDNPIPGEIPFPGGTIVITKGTLSLIQSPLERDFIICRNIMHISLRHPMIVMKREGIYGKLLRVLKTNPSKIDQMQLRKILQEYIKASMGMDQVKADKEGINLHPNPKECRASAIKFLIRWSEAFFPISPWDGFDLSIRIKALEAMFLH